MRFEIVFALLMLGCQPGAEDEAETDTATSTTATTTTTTTDEDTVVVGKINLGMNTGVLALQRSGGMIDEKPTGLHLSSDFPIVSYDDECDNSRSGWPKGFDSNFGSSGGSLAYNKAFVGCLMKHPDSRGETIMGALASFVSLMCKLGDKLVFDDVERTFDIDIDSSCYSTAFQELVQEIRGEKRLTGVKLTASKIDFDVNATGKWDGSIRFKFTGETEGVALNWDQIYLFDVDATNEVYSFATTYGDEADQKLTWPYAFGWAMSVDVKNGILRYEARQQEFDLPNNSEDGKSRHSRVILKGTLSHESGVSSIQSVELLYANGGKNSSGQPNSGSIKTVKGTASGGFYLKNYEVNNAGNGTLDAEQISNYQASLSDCITTSATCSGNSGFDFSSNDDLAFMMFSANTTPLKTWWTNVVPLTFNQVTTADYQY